MDGLPPGPCPSFRRVQMDVQACRRAGVQACRRAGVQACICSANNARGYF